MALDQLIRCKSHIILSLGSTDLRDSSFTATFILSPRCRPKNSKAPPVVTLHSFLVLGAQQKASQARGQENSFHLQAKVLVEVRASSRKVIVVSFILYIIQKLDTINTTI